MYLFGALFDCASTPVSRLEDAVKAKNYPAFYAALEQLERPLQPDETRSVARRLIQANWTARSFQALLDHSELPGELVWDTFGGDLTALSAACSARILDLLLRLGNSPNSVMAKAVSPLELAIANGNLTSVRRLLREPELDRSMTNQLWRLWAAAEERPEVRRCWQLAAPRLAGVEMPASGPVPLLEGLTLRHAAWEKHWALVCRICRERAGLTVEEALGALEQLMPTPSELPYLEELGRVLDAMFTACPPLLCERRPRQLLVLCCLELPKAPPVLLDWLDRLPEQTLPLWSERKGLAKRQWQGEGGLLARWRERLKLSPVLDRHKPLPCNFTCYGGFDDTDNACYLIQEEADGLICACAVCGEPVKGRLSRMARDVLERCSAGVIRTQLEPGGFLAREDPAVLCKYSAEECARGEVRGLLAAFVQEKDPYQL